MRSNFRVFAECRSLSHSMPVRNANWHGRALLICEKKLNSYRLHPDDIDPSYIRSDQAFFLDIPLAGKPVRVDSSASLSSDFVEYNNSELNDGVCDQARDGSGVKMGGDNGSSRVCGRSSEAGETHGKWVGRGNGLGRGHTCTASRRIPRYVERKSDKHVTGQ